MKNKTNKGVIISNGSLHANEVVIGDNTLINKNIVNEPLSNKEFDILKEEISTLIAELEKKNAPNEQIEAASLVRDQLDYKEPNTQIIKPILSSVLSSIKAVGSIASTVLAIKKILDLM